MQLLSRFKDYINDKELMINIYKNQMNVVNYTDIPHFKSNEIIIQHQKGSIIVRGSKLVITKLLNEELLINGLINKIVLKRYNE